MLSKITERSTRWKIRILARKFCKNKKDTPLPPKPPTTETIPVAPKVIEKKPPIKDLTGGRIFDPVTKKYQIAKIPPVSDAAKNASPNDTQKEQIRKRLRTAFASIAQAQEHEHSALPDTTPDKSNVNLPPTGGSGSPKNISRLNRSEPERVMFCLIPYSWVKAFNKKTGVTGFWTFMFTYSTYLFSKEKLVMEHEYYSGLSMILISYLAVRYIGPSIALGLDKQIDALENSFKQLRIDEQKITEENIQHEESLQLSMEAQHLLMQAKRENVDLQLEAEYRSRQLMVYKNVKKLLDFHVAYDAVQRKFAHQQMVEWTIAKAYQSITDEMDSQYVDKCLQDLETLSQSKQAL